MDKREVEAKKQELDSDTRVLERQLNDIRIDRAELEHKRGKLEEREKALAREIEKLREEKEALKALEIDVEREVNRELIGFLRENRDFVLAQLNHVGTTCSDNNPHINGYREERGYALCLKCFLTEILNDTTDTYADKFKVSMDFTITKF